MNSTLNVEEPFTFDDLLFFQEFQDADFLQFSDALLLGMQPNDHLVTPS